LEIHNCGAGTQSSAITLLVAEGQLAPPDAVVFADTGWEPAAVYEQMDRITAVYDRLGVPVYRVSRGNLRADTLDRRVFATVPAQVDRGWRTERVPDETMPCNCDWQGLFELDGHTGDKCERCHGEGEIVLSWRTRRVRDSGKVRRQCTGKYKIEPITQQTRILLGAPTRVVECRYCDATGERVAPWDPQAGPGQCSVCRGTGERRLVGSVPAGNQATPWIGFSADEMLRVNKTKADPRGTGRRALFARYENPRFPLLELGLTRPDCERLLRKHGWPAVKSACLGCPYSGNKRWRDIRDNHPAEWDDVVDFDRQLREPGSGMKHPRYLHASMLPLDEAPIDTASLSEMRERQSDLVEHLKDLDLEEGIGSCSPFGCDDEPDPDGPVDLGTPGFREAS
jgi:hypothetical protein